MSGIRGDEIHGERIVDGNASALTVLVIYKSGGFTAAGAAVARPIAADEFLCITDITISIETAADVSLLANAAAAGKYIFEGAMANTSLFVKHFEEPYVCPKGVTPKFKGSGSNKSSCTIQGYVTK